jgi:sugar phosphate isomerase/epimerase
MDRRTFVKAAGGAALGGMLGLHRTTAAWAGATAGTRSLEKIGVQLYTVRSLMQEDFAGTLEAVAAAGYQEVEFAGYFGHPPEEVKALLERVGLEAPAAHVPLDALTGDLAGTIEAARTIGHRYLVCPWLAPDDRVSIERYQELAAFWNEVGQSCRDAGLRFGYHNHDFEFEAIGGRMPFDVLLEETDPELVDFELDLFWITKGGQDPLRYFERHPGRFTLCHVKDMAAGGEMVEVGRGEIDFAAIFAQAERAGLKHFFVEHDQPADPLASIAASHDHLRALKF